MGGVGGAGRPGPLVGGVPRDEGKRAEKRCVYLPSTMHPSQVGCGREGGAVGSSIQSLWAVPGGKRGQWGQAVPHCPCLLLQHDGKESL